MKLEQKKVSLRVKEEIQLREGSYPVFTCSLYNQVRKCTQLDVGEMDKRAQPST